MSSSFFFRLAFLAKVLLQAFVLCHGMPDTADTVAGNGTDTTNETGSTPNTGSSWGLHINNGVIMRMTYVLLAICLLVIIYFGVKFFLLKRKRKPTLRRYDVLPTDRLQELTIEDESSESENELYDSGLKLVKSEPT